MSDLREVDVVDAHVHVLSADTQHFPRVHGADAQPWIDRASDANDFMNLARRSGVNQAVLVQPLSCYGSDNSYLQSLGLLEDARGTATFCCVGAIGPAFSDLALLSDFRAGGLLGVRVLIPESMTDAALALLHQTAEIATTMQLPVLLLLSPLSDRGICRTLIAAHRDAQFILDHCSLIESGKMSADEVSGMLRPLVVYENVLLKVTSINLLGPRDTATSILRLCLRLVGADRTMWGSDFPHSWVGGYDALIDVALDTSAAMRPVQRAAFLAGTARAVWPVLGTGRS